MVGVKRFTRTWGSGNRPFSLQHLLAPPSIVGGVGWHGCAPPVRLQTEIAGHIQQVRVSASRLLQSKQGGREQCNSNRQHEQDQETIQGAQWVDAKGVSQQPWPNDDVGLASSQLCRLSFVKATVEYMFSDVFRILVFHSNVIRPS